MVRLSEILDTASNKDIYLYVTQVLLDTVGLEILQSWNMLPEIWENNIGKYTTTIWEVLWIKSFSEYVDYPSPASDQLSY